MSSANRGRERIESDFYVTPAWAVHTFLNEVRLPGGVWLDPCAGDGAIVRACRSLVPDIEWRACEIRNECQKDLDLEVGAENVIIDDFLTTPESQVDVIFTNPPYSLAQEFIEKSIACAKVSVMLLRLNYLGSQKRCKFFRERAPDVYVLPKRPSFVYGRTDSTEYAWFVFTREVRRSGSLMVLSPPAEDVYETKNRRRKPRSTKVLLSEPPMGSSPSKD